MSKYLNHHCLATFLFLIITTISLSCSTTLYAAPLSQEDALILSGVNNNIAAIPHENTMINIQNGIISISGLVYNKGLASSLIATIITTPGVRNINIGILTLPDGKRVKPEAIIIGLTQGYLLRGRLFGNKVTQVSELPVRLSGEDGIIYVDGTVNNLHLLSTTIQTAQAMAQRVNNQIRIISRMNIRNVTVKLP